MGELSIKEGITELGVTTYDGQKAQVSSRRVAEVFEKHHHHVLRDIDNLVKNAEDEQFTATNFGLSEYKGKSGRIHREYLLSKDGVVLLAMGYNKKKFIDLKVEYIKEFNRMEQLIKERYYTRIEYEPMTDAIKEFRERQGKEVKEHHITIEADMLNLVVIGKRAREFRKEKGIEKGISIRDYIADWQVKAIKHLQRMNTDLLYSGLDYDTRKDILTKRFKTMFESLKITERND